MNNEQNINADVTIEIDKETFFFSGSVYYNHFFDYIYLAPTAEIFFGYPVYRYRQQDAGLSGTELMMIIKPASLKHLQWKEVFSLTNGKLKESAYLPFIAPAKLISSVRFEKQLKKGMTFFAEPEFEFVAAQNKPAQFETVTARYSLLNFSSGLEMPAYKGNWKFNINVNNITDLQYFDHLSRLKYLGLYNEGVNFAVTVRKEIF